MIGYNYKPDRNIICNPLHIIALRFVLCKSKPGITQERSASMYKMSKIRCPLCDGAVVLFGERKLLRYEKINPILLVKCKACKKEVGFIIK